jgi:hypothetical protein
MPQLAGDYVTETQNYLQLQSVFFTSNVFIPLNKLQTYVKITTGKNLQKKLSFYSLRFIYFYLSIPPFPVSFLTLCALFV